MFELNHVTDVTSSLAHSPHFALTIFNCALHRHLALPSNHNNHVRRRLQLPLCLPHHPPQCSCCGSRHPCGRSYRSPPGSSHSRSDFGEAMVGSFDVMDAPSAGTYAIRTRSLDKNMVKELTCSLDGDYWSRPSTRRAPVRRDLSDL
jgi:hypothetical protein